MNTEAKELRKQNEALEDILSRLIALKNYKDRHGKDEHYLKEQPVLWQVARETLYQCVGTPVPVAESGLHLADVTTCAYVVQNKKTMIVGGSFRKYNNALKYINGDLKNYNIIECYLSD